jgi:hypothetical protein
MYQLFAFHQASDVEIAETESGRYDAEQQLWVADEVSVARGNAIAPIGGDQTRIYTRGQATMTKDGPDMTVDAALD